MPEHINTSDLHRPVTYSHTGTIYKIFACLQLLLLYELAQVSLFSTVCSILEGRVNAYASAYAYSVGG
jgi:hypothetical protein